jgi:pyrroloquinoline quinone (PQQ) biosynthesis protein C
MAAHADFTSVVEARIQQWRSSLRYSFGQKVLEGRSTREELAIFAVQTYHRNLYSSRFASANHARCPIPEIRRALLEVVNEEEMKLPGEPPSHADLMLVFAEALGLRREDVIQARPLPSTLVFIDTIMKLSEGHWLEGMAFRASEIGTTKRIARGREALEKHYGFPPEALRWWRTHESADIRHGQIALEAYGKYARDEAEQAMSMRAIERMIAAWDIFNDGILKAGEEAPQGVDVGFPLPPGSS